MTTRTDNRRPPGGAPGDERALREVLEQAGRRPPVPPNEVAVIKAAAREEWRELVRRRKEKRAAWFYRGLVPAGVAATALVVVAAAWWLKGGSLPIASPGEAVASVELVEGTVDVAGPRTGDGRRLAVGDSLAAGTVLTTGAGERTAPRTALRFGTGHSVRLSTDTRLRLASASSIELERGTLYVDSGSNEPADSGLQIITRLGSVQELGTQYEVHLNDGGAALRVRVREGEVSLLRDHETHSAVAGEELTMRRDSVVRGTVERYGSHWEWTVAAAPALPIEDLRLGAYLDWVAREMGWQIRFADDSLAESAPELRVHGFEGFAPDESIDVVLSASGLDYRIEPGVLVVAEASAADGGR